jgi:hypothetical protein
MVSLLSIKVSKFTREKYSEFQARAVVRVLQAEGVSESEQNS